MGELRQLHAEILANLDALETLTAEAEPPMDRLPAVRHALTRASRARTIWLERVYERLIDEAPTQKPAIEALRAKGRENLTISTRHIGAWTLREIASRWPAYRQASAVMRAEMRRRVRDETELVYPLLARVRQ